MRTSRNRHRPGGTDWLGVGIDHGGKVGRGRPGANVVEQGEHRALAVVEVT